MKGQAPFLQNVRTLPEKIDAGTYPFAIPAFSRGIDLTFTSPVTFFVGENGSGKSTLLEALAEGCGFNPEGGSRDHHREIAAGRSPLLEALRLTWRPKVTKGFFLRAESFYNFATYIEDVSDMRAYGGKSLHEQSHGESFLALFAHRFDQGVFILETQFAQAVQRQLNPDLIAAHRNSPNAERIFWVARNRQFFAASSVVPRISPIARSRKPW